VLLVACLSVGCAEEPQRNLLLIVVDTLRADHLGAYGYPRAVSPEIDALAARGVRFERAYATAPWTQPSVASILTGLHPASHGADRLLRVLPGSANTLAERLQEARYATAAVVSHYLIGPRFGFDQGFETFVHGSALGGGRFSTPGVSARGGELLARLAREERPFFLFLHYFDPHYSYERHPDAHFASPGGAGRLTGEQSVEELRGLDPPPDASEAAFVRDLYDEEIRFTDAGIGRVLRALARLGLGDSTVVVLASDHGEEFWERGWLGHTRTLHDEVVRVPLIVRVPGAEPGTVADPVSLVSLASTLLDLLGVEGEGFQGRSFAPLLRLGSGRLPGPIYLETEYFRESQGAARLERKHALIDGRWKLVEDRVSGDRALYDLAADPDERTPLASRNVPLEKQLSEAAARYGSQRLEGAPNPVEPTPQERKMLEALGYVAE
jgi:arylsulfatase A-like enzyme